MKENNINKNKSTPVMRQYWEAKNLYPDSIMLFRMGDFYETFDEDAKITSKILGITLTKRANGSAASVPLAGFPYHAYDQYVYKLLQSGYKVALCEQVEDPKKSKGIVKRAVVELLSPGTAINNKFVNNTKNNFLASFYFGNNEISYSILDNSTGDFSCGETEKYNINDILLRYNVKEILVCEAQEGFIREFVSKDYMISTYEDWKTDYSTSYDKLIKHFKTKSLKGFGLENKPSAIIAASASLFYIENNYFGKTEHINSISYINKEGFMHIDTFTLKNLEIFESNNDNTKKGTLLNILDNTCTSSGSRMLTNHIIRPLTCTKKINYRLDVVDELFKKEFILNEIRKILKETCDLERVIGKISNDKANPRDILNLGRSIDYLKQIKKLFKSKRLKKANLFLNKIHDLSRVSRVILKTIKKDPDVNILKGNYIKEGFSKKLDELRAISSKANNWLVDYQSTERSKNNIPNLKISYNKVFGYYIDITKTHISKVPENYIRRQTLANSERYYTEELKNYESKILSAEHQIIELEKEMINNLKIKIMGYSKEIQNNAKILSKIDVFCSHAINAIQYGYNRPILKNSKNYILKDSRHPVVEKLLPQSEEFVSNDLELNSKNKQIAIITGPNMAGKSTYLRQVAQIALLGQIGSFVPAEKCILGVVDKLFTRVGASDNLSGGESTFLVEMNETANILNNATERSLIILDEIGRGTSTFDGLSLAWAITEYIHNSPKHKARTLFATHYHELIFLADQLKNCFNLNIQVKEYNNEVIFLRKIKEGGADKSYGIHVAQMAGLPKKVISRAQFLLIEFMNNKKVDNKDKYNIKDYDEQLSLLDKHDNMLIEDLKKININDLTPLQAISKLDELKKKYEN